MSEHKKEGEKSSLLNEYGVLLCGCSGHVKVTQGIYYGTSKIQCFCKRAVWIPNQPSPDFLKIICENVESFSADSSAEIGICGRDATRTAHASDEILMIVKLVDHRRFFLIGLIALDPTNNEFIYDNSPDALEKTVCFIRNECNAHKMVVEKKRQSGVKRAWKRRKPCCAACVCAVDDNHQAQYVEIPFISPEKKRCVEELSNQDTSSIHSPPFRTEASSSSIHSPPFKTEVSTPVEERTPLHQHDHTLLSSFSSFDAVGNPEIPSYSPEPVLPSLFAFPGSYTDLSSHSLSFPSLGPIVDSEQQHFSEEPVSPFQPGGFNFYIQSPEPQME